MSWDGRAKGWTPYVPTFTGSVSDPAPSTIEGVFTTSIDGGTLNGGVDIIFGASGYGSGNFTIGLPAPMRNAHLILCTAFLAGTGLNVHAIGRSPGGTTVELRRVDTNALVGSTTGWTNLSRLQVSFTYEPA